MKTRALRPELASETGRHGLVLACLGALLLVACTASDAVRLVVHHDPEAALESAARARLTSYTYNPQGFAADMERARSQLESLLAVLRGEAGEVWGDDDTVVPGRKRYVKYTQNYRSRAIIRFDAGEVRVETVDPDNPRRSLRTAIVSTLLTPSDPRAVDLYSDEPVRLSGEPYLHGLVRDHRGRTVGGPKQAEAYAAHLLANDVRERDGPEASGRHRVLYVDIPMVNDHRDRRVERYRPIVERYANRFGVSQSLVYAVIKTESDFNPFAVSSAPAYGLMQLVPATGGRDAYRHVKNRDRVPGREYLFDPENNIELGVAYLQLVRDRYLAGIRDPVSLEYCTIAAYNGGAGNVLETFSADRGQAVARINELRPPQVYRRLRYEHRREETRHYLRKVLEARRQYSGV